MVDDVIEELNNFLGPALRYGPCLDPFGELVDGDTKMHEAPEGLLQGSN